MISLPSFMMTRKGLGGVFEEPEVLQRVAVEQEQVGRRPFFDDSELAGDRVPGS